MSTYPKHSETELDPSPDLPAMEERTLAYWQADATFEASVEARAAGDDGANEFVFYDGPPFANGLPHYGHLLTGYVKDAVPRYETMRGRRVERRFGWDCHGLPAEVEAEKQLGITHKSEIDQMGVAQFNDACRTSVLRYTSEWRDYVTRQARWVDFDHDYKTLDLPYMESVMWAFKTLWDKGYVYEGYRVLWYCFRCETPLSNQESKMDDSYRPRQDTAVTVAFTLEDGTKALAWTTTPWTLPSNLALAVHPDVEYVVVEAPDGDRVLLAEARLAAYARELGKEPQVLRRMTGRELAGIHYTPLFDFFAGRENAHQILLADYVTTEDGTGIVHIAPAFGEEDKEVTDAAGIEVANPVDSHGSFTSEVPPYEGMNVFDANPVITKDLKAKGVLVRQESYEHSYPHCWRCDTPLIQKAVSSWFVAVTKFRDRMVELNQQIRWAPEHVKDGQFGKWLQGARDWSISRNRYWGSPIPVWCSDDPAYPRTDVYGSLDELERDFGVRPTDLHRPFVDELTRPNPDDPTGKSTMRRVPEVLDCWFDSGSMPFAQVHYPFENREWFDHHYPGDFIVEYIGQTRGWFYLLHVLATALFDRPAFKSCIAHGIVLGSDGRKMSKSLRNYPDVTEVFDRDGSDAMRWYLLDSPLFHGGNLVVTDQGIRDTVRRVLLPVWNSYYFFALYANACNGGEGYTARLVEAGDELTELDRHILAATRKLAADVGAAMDAYDLAGACSLVLAHLDVLSNWYIRRARDRFWAEDKAAFNTLYTALTALCRVMAPLAPLLAEEVYRGLTGERSVHLTDWPDPDASLADAAALPADDGLVATVERVREICSVALGLRKGNSLRVRQPLSSLLVAVPDEQVAAVQHFADVIAQEVNVKQVTVCATSDGAATDYGVFTQLVVNARAAGPRLGGQVQHVIRAAKAGTWRAEGAGVIVETEGGDIALEEAEYTLKTVVADREGDTLAAGVLSGDGFEVLELSLDDALLGEGYARDVIRAVQDERKAAGLHVADRIALSIAVPRDWQAAVREHEQLIAAETLATSVTIDDAPTGELAVHVAKQH